MKIVIAMDSFKGTLSSKQAGNIVKNAFLDVFEDAATEVVCIADGGEGTVEAVMKNIDGAVCEMEVIGPIGKPVFAHYGMMGDMAVIEMAQASGLTLIENGRGEPLAATTYGTGQLMKRALDAGAKRMIIGIGGSATNDGGAGMAQALGARFLDASGEEIGFGGAALAKLASIDMTKMDKRIFACEIIVACDVTNPLYGMEGASFVYGPQKGANEKDVMLLDYALRQLADIAIKRLGKDYSLIPGAGAAGGLGFGLMAFCGAVVKPGIEMILEISKMKEKLEGADLLITGEGCMDKQALNGKAPMGVCSLARENNVPAIAIAGQVKGGSKLTDSVGLQAAIACVNRIMSFEEVKKESGKRLYNAAFTAARLLKIGTKIKI